MGICHPVVDCVFCPHDIECPHDYLTTGWWIPIGYIYINVCIHSMYEYTNLFKSVTRVLYVLRMIQLTTGWRLPIGYIYINVCVIDCMCEYTNHFKSHSHVLYVIYACGGEK